MQCIKRIGLVLILALSISAAFPAQDASVLLEKAIYTEETLGNLQEAIGIYQQVVASAEAGRATAAQALYRMGMCYQKSGRTADAQAVFSKLTRLYPDQQELIARIPVLTHAPQFRAAPWEDGELLQYSMIMRGSGSAVGFTVLTIESAPEAGKTGWKSRMISGLAGPMESSSTRMDAHYAPMEHREKGPEQVSAADYKYLSDRVEVSKTTLGAAKTMDFRLSRSVYDPNQVIYLLRCLPLREGFTTTLPVLKTSDGSVIDMKVVVEGRETIIVAGRSYDCFKVLTQTPTAELAYWFTRDSHLYPVRFGLSGTAELELNRISKMEKNRPYAFVDSELGLSLSLPPGWIGVSSKMLGTSILSLIDPEDASNCYMGFGKAAADMDLKTYMPKALDSLITMLQGQYKDFQMRAGGREDTTISGLPGIRITADHKAMVSPQDMVTYLFIFTSRDQLGQMHFRTNVQNFDKLRPAFDAIAYSVQVK